MIGHGGWGCLGAFMVTLLFLPGGEGEGAGG